MELAIRNPANKQQVAVLTPAQWLAVQSYVIGKLNERQGRGKIDEGKVLSLLDKAGLPVTFED